ncbi:hypothetical protein niasHT_034443 [Heterodera trifolii]|uniref:polynucleotide adenylyltransferase n=1 Tax=Heterodera trifolii TaxID=157864 RepID=A0ABD2I7T5_9BILA
MIRCNSVIQAEELKMSDEMGSFILSYEISSQKMESIKRFRNKVKGIVNGFRSAKYLLRIVLYQPIYKSLLKIVKIWARKRLIDSNIFGYLNGAALSVMAAKICVIHPNAPLLFLCQQFFALYSKWDWQNVPVLLEEVSSVPLNSLVRPPKVVAHSMTVITPRFPEQNATHTVNKNTREIIVEQLQIAHQILSLNVHNWHSVFDEIQIKDHFRHFAIIVCSSTVFNNYVTKCGYQKSKIRQNLMGWAESEEVAKKVKRYQAIPSFEQKLLCADKNEASSAKLVTKSALLCTLWLIGLTAHDEFNEHFSDNLPSIYQNEKSKQKIERIFIESIFTNSENLDAT